MTKFKGFAIRNDSGKEIAITVINESSFPKKFILKPRQVYYARVADIIQIQPLKISKQNGFKPLEETQ